MHSKKSKECICGGANMYYKRLKRSSNLYIKSCNLCLSVGPIKIQEPLDRFASNFDWGTRETHVGMFLDRIKDSNLSVSTLTARI